MRKIKCSTIEQYYVYQWIKKNFVVSALRSVEKWSPSSLLITDKNLDYMLVSYKNGKIKHQ